PSCMLNTTMCVSGATLRRCSISGRPLPSGSDKSSATRSGRCWATASTASSALRHSATTLKSGSSPISRLKPSRTMAWSSTRTMLYMGLLYTEQGWSAPALPDAHVPSADAPETVPSAALRPVAWRALPVAVAGAVAHRAAVLDAALRPAFRRAAAVAHAQLGLADRSGTGRLRRHELP